MGSILKFIFTENFHAISILTGRKTKEKTQQKENQQTENFTDGQENRKKQCKRKQKVQITGRQRLWGLY